MILLHGFLGDARDWEGLVGGLGDRPRVVVDLPGHGSSIGLAEKAYTLAGAADAVVGVADLFGWCRFALVGYSMGGRIAYHVAVAHADRVAGLVAVSAHPGLADPASRAARRRRDAARAARLVRDPALFVRDWYAQPIFSTLARDPGLLARILARRQGIDPVGVARALRGLSTGRQAPLAGRIRALDLPVLLVSGTLDAAYDRLLADLARGRLGHASVPEAGHAVHLERPEAFLRIVRAFIDQACP